MTGPVYARTHQPAAADEPDVEVSLRRIADTFDREARRVTEGYPIIAEYLHSEATRLRGLTG